MAAALQVWSQTFSKAFDSLPAGVREAMQSKIDEMGLRLGDFSHKRLQGRPEYKLRAGDYRVLYEFDVSLGEFTFTMSAIVGKFINVFRLL